MKKAGIALLILTAVFISFAAGMLVGRSIDNNKTTIQKLSEQASTETIAPVATISKLPQERININTASVSLLDTLPGIGPVLAQRIIDYRTQHGPFSKASDISNVEGIGSEKLLAILDLITVEE